MNLLRTSFFNGIAVGIRMLTALLLNKILAIYVGPTGYAVIGQFQNIVSMLTVFVTGGMANGVTKYTAEYFADAPRQQRLWGTAATITATGAALAVVFVLLFRHTLAMRVLRNDAYTGIFLWLAVSLLFLGLNTLLLSILNGKKDVGRYLSANIAGSLVSLAVTGLMAWQLGLYGALVALSINQSLAFFVTLFLCWRASWFVPGRWVGWFDVSAAKKLAKFAIMGVTTAIATPVSLILIRNHLRASFGWDAAGYWDAMSRISTIYLSLVTTTLSLYYLPRISEIGTRIALRREIFHVFRHAVPITAMISLTIFLFRHLIIRLLFTPKFLPMEQLFAFQLIGDVVKIASWVIAFVMIGRAMARWFIVTELLASINYWLLVIVFTNYIGFQGVTLAYLVNYTLYFAIVSYIVLGSKAPTAVG